MTIRWGVSPIAWANDDMPELGGDITLDALLTDVREIGFDGVELGNKFPRDPVVLAPIMAAHGLSIVGGWYSANLLTRDIDAEIVALQPHLHLLEQMGSRTFVVAETSNAVHGDRTSRLDTHPVLDDAQWDRFARGLNRLAAYLDDHGFRLAYHYHLGTAVETSVELDRFIRSTNDRVGLVVDTGHATLGGIDPVALVRDYPARVAHVHCKDVRAERHRTFRSEGLSFLDGVVGGMFTAPGDGDYDFEPFFEALRDIGYKGWIVIEAEQDPGVADPRHYQQLGLDTLKRIATEIGLTS